MENRDVRQQDVAVIPQTSNYQLIRERPLSDAELDSLVQFFELLDRWDREVVQ